ncbi:ATP-binding cassette domain-containing protein [Clostridium sp.]|uniref:ATP-binding cassette domain-containing protein n=1 Tax=Clostridium sp. TaxID=1506 RepID=UPI003F2BA436
MNNIIIQGAKEGNLKNVSLEIPKNKLVVFTGLSGCGKSTLAVDTIFNECQRQYLEAMGLQGIQKPDIEAIKNAAPAIIITQQGQNNKNPRSSVGTVTNIYTDLRMIYEKLSKRTCPNCNEEISAANCKEELEKDDAGFKVYMYCNKCNHKMEKLTRSHFSYNTREGACKKCEGLGKILKINKDNLVNEDLSLEDGAIDYWDKSYKDYQISILHKAFKHYGLDINEGALVKEFTEGQKAILFYGVESEEAKAIFPNVKLPKTVTEGKFEGVYAVIWRRLSDKGGDTNNLASYFEESVCNECNGERLSKLSREAVVLNKRLPQLVSLSLEELYEWILEVENELESKNKALVESYLIDLKTKLKRIINVGIGYLTLDRQTGSLSGGEAQRIKLSAALDSSITGIIYVMDEPTMGLHSKDTLGIINELKALRDKGNTVIVIEHDIDVMKAADYIVDIGPGAGKHGGEIIATGTFEEILKNPLSVTGEYLKREKTESKKVRKGNGSFIEIKNANIHNLKNVNAKFPIGCLTSVTGVSGSGKSTLVFDVLGCESLKSKEESNIVLGKDEFKNIITIEQSPLTRMKRSNVGTYSGVYTEIRKIFGSLDESKEKGLNVKHFSFNTKGGRCENCEGLGYVVSNMLFFKDIEVICPICGGNQFNDQVLSVKYKGNSIKDILKMSIEEAIEVFNDEPKILKTLNLLNEVGVGYLELGQTLTTLSGGEGQRLKLAKELIESKGKKNLYLIDEPTTGLHPIDIENFLKLLDRMVDSGNTVIVVEHNGQIINASDWVIDLGPEGGINGGEVIAVGTPAEIKCNNASATGKFL